MAYRYVSQPQSSGCFVACVAMMMGKTYQEAFKLVHPDRQEWDRADLHPFAAIERLKALGFKVRYAQLKKLRSLKRDALLCIKWDWAPELGHAVLYDSEQKKFLDPGFRRPLSLSEYQRQLCFVAYFDRDNQQERRS
jgi:ABC-type bacteriocin/lantibiotic exporter with double-glycine peptidase domain